MWSRKASRAVTSARTTRGRSFSKWALSRTDSSCFTWAAAWTYLQAVFAPFIGALSGGISMASATNSRRMSVALLAAATTAVLVWFGSGLFPIWLLLWLFAPPGRVFCGGGLLG